MCVQDPFCGGHFVVAKQGVFRGSGTLEISNNYWMWLCPGTCDISNLAINKRARQ